MRVLMVNNFHYLRGGSERVMFDEMAALEERGHDVACFSARHRLNVPGRLEEIFPEVQDPEGLSVLRKIQRFPSVIANDVVARSFATALDRFVPDVVHFHNIYGRLTPLVAEVARERGVPSVMTAHDYKLICPAYLRLNGGRACSACSYGRYLPAFFGRCHKNSRLYSILYGIEATVNVRRGRYDGIFAFLCPSRFLFDSLARAGVPSDRLRYLPNVPRAMSGASPAKPPGTYVLYTGRLSPEKGIACLLRAIVGTSIELVVAGDGPLAPQLRQFVAAEGLTTRVRFLGHCAPEALPELVAGARAVVVPSECFENAPLAVLEAFALGKPVVGADIGGIPELVLPGVTGALFPPGDARALQRALVETLASASRSAEMGRHAQEVIRERFSLAAHVEALVDTYEDAVRAGRTESREAALA